MKEPQKTSNNPIEILLIPLLGAPGAGKRTQANYITSQFGAAQLSIPMLAQSYLKKNTLLGSEIKNQISAGQTLSDDLLLTLVVQELNAVSPTTLDKFNEIETKPNFAFLTGFPYTVSQANMLDKSLNNLVLEGKTIRRESQVTYLNVSRNELLKRIEGRLVCMQCHTSYHNNDYPPIMTGHCDNDNTFLQRRQDDIHKLVSLRLEIYFRQIEPLLNFYAKQGRLFEVDGEGSVDEIACRVLLPLLNLP